MFEIIDERRVDETTIYDDQVIKRLKGVFTEGKYKPIEISLEIHQRPNGDFCPCWSHSIDKWCDTASYRTIEQAENKWRHGFGRAAWSSIKKRPKSKIDP